MELKLERLLAKIRNKRLIGNRGIAWASCDEVDRLFQDAGGNQYYSQRSTLYFEKSILLQAEGKYEEANSTLDESKKYCDLASDQVRWCYAEYQKLINLFYSGQTEASDTIHNLKKLDGDLPNRGELSIDNQQLLDSFEYTLIIHLSWVSFEFDLAEFRIWSERLKDNKRWIETIASGGSTAVLIQLQVDARLAMASGDFKSATSIFLSILGCGDEALKRKFEVAHLDKHVQEWIFSGSHYLARDYRDCARCLEKISKHDFQKWINDIRIKGMKLADGNGNKRFLMDLKNDAAQVD